MDYIIVAFGEIDISPATIAILLGLTTLTFGAVAISSLKLLNFGKDES